jgi:hypothetical protein
MDGKSWYKIIEEKTLEDMLFYWIALGGIVGIFDGMMS